VPSTLPLHAPKSGSYYGLPRADLIELLSRPVGRVLDVGCGEGGAAAPLRTAGASWISGIEVLTEPAKRAAEYYDEVQVGDASDAVLRVSGPFDTILCYDVLEHIYDPEQVLRRLLEVSRPGGQLHVSVPNARHVSLLRDLIVRGTFGYEPQGHRDVTHIRWFTRRDIVALLGESGWLVQSVSHSALHKSRFLHWLTRGRTTEYLAAQWYVRGRSREA
jgi:2-polyprenyl-3-methyl-5-hydroxy-6-metoxy-1,4-benzoquinol methylase